MSYAGGSRLCTRVAFHGVCGLASCAAVAAICSAQHGSGRVPPITDAGGGAITTRVGAKGCVGECRSGVADDGTAMRGGHGSGGGLPGGSMYQVWRERKNRIRLYEFLLQKLRKS